MFHTRRPGVGHLKPQSAFPSRGVWEISSFKSTLRNADRTEENGHPAVFRWQREAKLVQGQQRPDQILHFSVSKVGFVNGFIGILSVHHSPLDKVQHKVRSREHSVSKSF